MSVCYDKLWKMLIDRKISKTEMRLAAGITTNMLAKMGKDEAVNLDTLVKVALFLDCGIDDILEFEEKSEGDK